MPGNRCHRTLQLSNDRPERTRQSRFPSHKNHTNPPWKAFASSTVSFSKSPPRSIPAHSAPDLPAHCKSGLTRSFPRTPKKNKLRALDPLPFSKNSLKLAAPPEPLRPGKRPVTHQRTRALTISLNGQPLPPLCPAALEDLPPALRFHPF